VGSLIVGALLIGFPTPAFADHHRKDSLGYVYKSANMECMYLHAHISKPSNNMNEWRYRPYIFTRATMDYGIRSWQGHTIQCGDKKYEAPGGTIHMAQHLAVWSYRANNWFWCNNGPEIMNGGYAHEVYTEWWWWGFPCQDIADSAWFFNRGYYRGDTNSGTFARLQQTEWLYAGGN
jgi:hypothetical protein